MWPSLNKAASTVQVSEHVPPRAQENSGVPEVPNGKWKILLDLPMFIRATGEPREVSIKYTTWKRRLVAVSETVCHVFAKFVGGQFTLAHRRHEALMAGGSRQPIAEVPCEYKEYEARLVVVGLLRVLPQDINNGQ